MEGKTQNGLIARWELSREKKKILKTKKQFLTIANWFLCRLDRGLKVENRNKIQFTCGRSLFFIHR